MATAKGTRAGNGVNGVRRDWVKLGLPKPAWTHRGTWRGNFLKTFRYGTSLQLNRTP